MTGRRPAYKYALFDWDGCLAETLDIWMRNYRRVFNEHGLFPTVADIGRAFGDWRGPVALGVPDDRCDDFNRQLINLVDEEITTVVLAEGARETLETLAQHGVRIAVVSSSVRSHVEPRFDQLGIDQLVDALVASEDVEHHKPNPEALDIALSRIGGTRESAVIVGDSSKDLGAAANAGIDAVLVHPDSHGTYYDIEYLRSFRPAALCTTFAEVTDFLLPKA